jgi:hypothetical protein
MGRIKPSKEACEAVLKAAKAELLSGRETALDIMERVMRGDRSITHEQFAAAVALAPYRYPKLSCVAVATPPQATPEAGQWSNTPRRPGSERAPAAWPKFGDKQTTRHNADTFETAQIRVVEAAAWRPRGISLIWLDPLQQINVRGDHFKPSSPPRHSFSVTGHCSISNVTHGLLPGLEGSTSIIRRSARSL